MPINKSVHTYTSLVPVVFSRAPNANDATVAIGPPAADAPDPDNRGYTRTAGTNLECMVLPVGLDESLASAAVPETRVRLSRVAMENAGSLFATCSETDVAEITSPANGAALPSQQHMMVKFKAKTTGNCFLEVRFGAIDGPIIHRIQLVVSAIRTLRVKAHAPVINGARVVNARNGTPVPAQSTNNTLAAIQGVLAGANAIFFPYGIRFRVDPNNDSAPLNLTTRGAIDLNVHFATDQFDTAQQSNRAGRGAINMYFVPQIIDTDPDPDIAAGPDSIGGVAMNARNNPTDFGMFLADWAAGGQTTAHELGHILNLVNDTGSRPKYIHINTRDDPSAPGTGIEVRDDIISRRRLMFAYTNFPNAIINFSARPVVGVPGLMTYRNNVGYGANQPGSMLAIKQYDQDRTDFEMAEVQSSARWLLSRP